MSPELRLQGEADRDNPAVIHSMYTPAIEDVALRATPNSATQNAIREIMADQWYVFAIEL